MYIRAVSATAFQRCVVCCLTSVSAHACACLYRGPSSRSPRHGTCLQHVRPRRRPPIFLVRFVHVYPHACACVLCPCFVYESLVSCSPCASTPMGRFVRQTFHSSSLYCLPYCLNTCLNTCAWQTTSGHAFPPVPYHRLRQCSLVDRQHVHTRAQVHGIQTRRHAQACTHAHTSAHGLSMKMDGARWTERHHACMHTHVHACMCARTRTSTDSSTWRHRDHMAHGAWRRTKATIQP